MDHLTVERELAKIKDDIEEQESKRRRQTWIEKIAYLQLNKDGRRWGKRFSVNMNSQEEIKLLPRPDNLFAIRDYFSCRFGKEYGEAVGKQLMGNDTKNEVYERGETFFTVTGKWKFSPPRLKHHSMLHEGALIDPLIPFVEGRDHVVEFNLGDPLAINRFLDRVFENKLSREEIEYKKKLDEGQFVRPSPCGDFDNDLAFSFCENHSTTSYDGCVIYGGYTNIALGQTGIALV